MKKTFSKILSILCTVAIITTSLVSCSSSGITDEAIYQSAVDLIEEAKRTDYKPDAIEKYRKAIENLERITDYSNTPVTLNDAKVAHDKLVIEQVKYCYQFDYFEIDNWLSKMYDQKKADSVIIWMDFSQDIIINWYNEIVKAIKSNLKNPNSFTDVGSSYSYTTKAGNATNVVIVQNLTYKIDYTATNSFGGAVRDQFEYTFKDLNYTFESELVTSKEIAEVIKYSDFDDMCNSLFN